METVIETLLKALELKDEKRTGQEIYNISEPDSVAGHSWNVVFLTMLFGEGEDVNMKKALKIATVHDLAEAETGDIAKRADEDKQDLSDEEKEVEEFEAITGLSESLNSHEIRMLWKEYEDCQTPEARLVNDMDHIEKCLTALKNEKEENYDPGENDTGFENLDEFFETAEKEFKTGFGEELFNEIKSRYEDERE
ncbi:MAG: HD domain-containing protein [Nanohaloarchaea archaeon]|nr:HD domain-containing protein [Candidatus Nanohaloarchaea archaeon]